MKRFAPRIASCSTSRVRPPTKSAETNCHSEMSKHGGAVWATTSPSPILMSSILAQRWLSMHAGMLNHLCAKIDDMRIGEGDVVAQTAPPCFDISLWQLVSALLVGGRTLLVEQEAILGAKRFVDKIIDGRVAVVQVVPSYLEVLLSYVDRHPRELQDLRYVAVTAEELTKELTHRWFAA